LHVLRPARPPERPLPGGLVDSCRPKADIGSDGLDARKLTFVLLSGGRQLPIPVIGNVRLTARYLTFVLSGNGGQISTQVGRSCLTSARETGRL